ALVRLRLVNYLCRRAGVAQLDLTEATPPDLMACREPVAPLVKLGESSSGFRTDGPAFELAYESVPEVDLVPAREAPHCQDTMVRLESTQGELSEDDLYWLELDDSGQKDFRHSRTLLLQPVVQ